MVEITAAARSAPGQRAGERATETKGLFFRADRDALLRIQAALDEAEAAAARLE